jgi:hypothetical protein
MAQAHHVVRRRSAEELPIHAGATAVPQFAQAADALHPTEDQIENVGSNLSTSSSRSDHDV